MAENKTTFGRTEQFPPNYLAQFYSGVPGSNVPGIMPLLNQDLYNKMMGFGVEGANPYTYSGERIYGFTPAQEEAFRMTAEGMGSYLPYYQRAEQLTEGGMQTAGGAYQDLRTLLGKAVQAGELSTDEAVNLLRQAPGVGASATAQGLGQVGGALGKLGQAAGVGYGSTRGFNPSGVASFYNPFEDQVVEQTMEDVRKGLAQGDIARRAGEVGVGAFGGSRSRLQSDELAQAAAKGAAQQVGAIRAGGYQDASRRAQAAFEAQQGRQANQANLLAGLSSQQAGIGTQIAGMGHNLAGLYGTTAGGLGSLGGNLANIYGGTGRDVFGAGSQYGQLGMGAGTQMAGYGQGISGLYGTDISRMYGMGGMQQGMGQRGLDLDYGNFVGQYNLPMETIGQAGSMATSMAPAMGGYGLTYGQEGGQTNPFMQAAGLASTAYGLFQPQQGQ